MGGIPCGYLPILGVIITDKIKVIDSIMGSGKTEWAIKYMNDNPDERFIYITPYNDEIDNRILVRCNGFKTGRDGSKVQDFKNLLEQGVNIAATHECFKRADDEIRQLIETQGYILILDEVMDVVDHIPLTKSDIKTILDRHAKIENNYLVWYDDDYEPNGRFADVMVQARTKGLVAFPDENGNINFILWLFPPDLFKCFNDVFVLTYMFDAQIQRYYFDLSKIPYEKYKVKGSYDTGFELTEYLGLQDDKSRFKIDIYEGRLNACGEKASLSYTWFTSKKNQVVMNALGKSLRNYLRNIQNASASEILWTCYGAGREILQDNGYKVSFASCNLRATNKYNNRHVVAYCLNRYMRPVIKNFFAQNGITVDEDDWALSEMLQFLWRSALRKYEPINVYVPSKRMRNFLRKWIGLEVNQNKFSTTSVLNP